MRRRTTASALLAVILLAGASAGQPPAAPPDPTDALIQKALANDPDVQVARAKLALAEAEVAKARQAAVSRVLNLRITIELHRRTGERLTADLAIMKKAVGGFGREAIVQAEEQQSVAIAALVRAETELRLLTGDGPKAKADPNSATTFLSRLLVAEGGAATDVEREKVLRVFAGVLDQARAVEGLKSLAGPIPARLGAALEKRVSLGAKGQRVTLAEALDVFKAKAGFDIPVRPMPQPLPEIVSDGVELPVIAWLQMFQDLGGRQGEGFAFYVREYGLLVANRQTAPPDAVSLTAFWRAHSEAEAAPVPKQPEPKQPAGKQHEFAHDKLPATIKVKAGETIFVTFPVKTADVEAAKVASDSPAVVVQVASRERMVLVSIRSERAGKARVTWDLTDATGRRFSERGREVEFE